MKTLSIGADIAKRNFVRRARSAPRGDGNPQGLTRPARGPGQVTTPNLADVLYE